MLTTDRLTILQGDALTRLRELPAASVQCCVTSPPYWGLRDYGVDGQMGLEKTPEEYVAKMVELFREVRRVLKSDGTLWLNLGDTYAASGRGGGGGSFQNNAMGREITEKNGFRMPAPGYKMKDLVGVPWMMAFALRNDGWYLRSDIIWHKPNPMPESVTDRPTKAHEYIFLLTKAERYFYDADAIKEPLAKASHLRLAQDVESQNGSARVPGKTNGNMKAVGGGMTFGGAKARNGSIPEGDPRSRNGSEQWGREYFPSADGAANKKTVWTVTTQPYADAHFATYPPDLIKPCILAGSRPGDVVLDPFGGSGTTGQVALELGRRAVLIELNPEYIKLIEQRTNVTPGFDFAPVSQLSTLNSQLAMPEAIAQ